MKVFSLSVTILTPVHPDDLSDLFGATVNVTFEDVCPLSAFDMADNEENVVRLAEQMVRHAFRKFREGGK